MAVGSYDANGIWQYGESDNISPISATLNKLASSTSSGFTSDRARLATLEAGSLSGLIPVSPTSVSIAGGTAGLNSLGVISFSAGTTSLSINGLPTSTYAKFKAIYRIQVSANGNQVYFKNRAAGVDYTINYFGGGFQCTYTGNLTAQVAINNGGYGWIGTGATNTNSLQGTIEFQPIAGTSTYSFTAYSTQVSGMQGGGYESPSGTKPDGFTIFPSAGTMQGTIQIFGYND